MTVSHKFKRLEERLHMKTSHKKRHKRPKLSSKEENYWVGPKVC